LALPKTLSKPVISISHRRDGSRIELEKDVEAGHCQTRSSFLSDAAHSSGENAAGIGDCRVQDDSSNQQDPNRVSWYSDDDLQKPTN
jgi:hypothetical protein